MPDELSVLRLAELEMIQDAGGACPGIHSAMVIDLARGKRVSIFASASPVIVAAAYGVAVIPSGARVWIAMGQTDMRCGMQNPSAMLQHNFSRDPFAAVGVAAPS
ncbi:hypothetical protein JJC00_08350 [Bradyrhizobium diazoefficiens]|uniref:hypothetical protein n=1 Tax=Bradyrhizobium diazoefficiens TaxID=1355477 RepID=UPI00190D61EF|nr:hypothetical protein [Bradyrhizobium diazoefficiens]QQO35595.1 hypothetical protein JJC00_08350 [Bradyrhizobium diazoefficiens]